jgi:hypothetical protein
MKTLFSTILLLLSATLGNAQETKFKTKFDTAVPVFNLGTFHMGYIDDANKTEFYEHSQENIQQVHKIAQMIAEFKPTIIIVETTPQYEEKLQRRYLEYLENPKIKFENPNEIELLAYEVGRLSQAKRIYGIDYKENYNYNIYNSISNKVNSLTSPKYNQMMKLNEDLYFKESNKNASVLEMLKITNHPDYLDFLININADMLTYVSTKGKSEGADEAAKFYHRNLVMYSNLNQIELDKEDRIFILMGQPTPHFLMNG